MFNWLKLGKKMKQDTKYRTVSDRQEQSQEELNNQSDLSAIDSKVEIVDEDLEDVNEQGNQNAIVKKLQEQIVSLTKERDHVKEEFLLKAADFDNWRKRIMREKEDWIKYAHEPFVSDLLVIVDNFERALIQELPLDLPAVGQFRQGIEMNLKLLMDVFKRHGVTEVEAMQKPFDPNLHQAMLQVESSEHDDHTIIEVLQKGYMLKGRLLRPSMVKVTIKPA